MNAKGFSLVEVIIGGAILALSAMTFASVLVGYQREARSLTQKLEILDLKQNLTSTLSSSAVCACNFDPNKNGSNTSSLRFDINSLANAEINLSKLYASCGGGGPTGPILTPGENLPGTGSGLKVSKVVLKNLQATADPQVFRGKLDVEMDSASMQISRKPASVDMNLRVDASNATQSFIVNCASVAAGDVLSGSSNSCTTRTCGGGGGRTTASTTDRCNCSSGEHPNFCLYQTGSQWSTISSYNGNADLTGTANVQMPGTTAMGQIDDTGCTAPDAVSIQVQCCN